MYLWLNFLSDSQEVFYVKNQLASFPRLSFSNQKSRFEFYEILSEHKYPDKKAPSTLPIPKPSPAK